MIVTIVTILIYNLRKYIYNMNKKENINSN